MAGDGVVYVVDMEEWIILTAWEYSQTKRPALAIHKERNELAVGYSDNFIRCSICLTIA